MTSYKPAPRGLLSIVMALASSWLQADEVTLIANADAGLFEGAALNNLGGTAHISSGTTGTGQNSRGLFRFDIAGGLPAGALITSASLTLTVVRQPSNGGEESTFAIHRLLHDWGEGNKSALNNGASATGGESSWSTRFSPAVLWAAPGGRAGTDYVSSASSTRLISGLGSYTFSGTDALINNIQTWMDNPGENHGWILISQSEGSEFTARRFATREHMTASIRPSLVIGYRLPLLLKNPAAPGADFRFEFEGKAGRSYLVQRRSSFFRNDTWVTFQDIPALAQAGPIVVTDPLTATNKYYRVVEQ